MEFREDHCRPDDQFHRSMLGGRCGDFSRGLGAPPLGLRGAHRLSSGLYGSHGPRAAPPHLSCRLRQYRFVGPGLELHLHDQPGYGRGLGGGLQRPVIPPWSPEVSC